MTPDIIRKLEAEIRAGIRTEAQVVYLMVQIRKLLETRPREQYQYLKLHCDWALHRSLDRRAAQDILEHFNAAHIRLRDEPQPQDLPRVIQRISKMEFFREEMYQFFDDFGLPELNTGTPDSWTHFLHLYVQVIEDCPLEIRNNERAEIERVVVNIELARELVEREQFYKIIWSIHDTNGETGEIFIINSFQPA